MLGYLAEGSAERSDMATASAQPKRMTLAQARRSENAVLTRTEIAAILNVDARTVTRGIEAGEIPSIRLGRRVLVPREPFIALMTGDTEPAACSQ